MSRRERRRRGCAAVLALVLALSGLQTGSAVGTQVTVTAAAGQSADAKGTQEQKADALAAAVGLGSDAEEAQEQKADVQAAAQEAETQEQKTEAQAAEQDTSEAANDTAASEESEKESRDGAESETGSESETSAAGGDSASGSGAESSGTETGTGETGETAVNDTPETEPVSGAETESETEPGTESETESETEEYLEASVGVDALLKATGSSVSGSGVADTVKFVPGTYTVTANLYVPGEYNKVLKANAYLTNPNNPSGIGGHTGVPLDPVSDNATLTIGEDGTTKTLTLDVVNPVFTLQSIGGASGVSIVKTVWDSETYSYTGTDGTVTHYGRITQLTLQLENNSGEYSFSNCKEFPTILGEDWTVPLNLAVDLSTVPTNLTVELLSGNDGTWAAGSTGSLSFVAKEAYSKYTGLTVDGTEVPTGSASSFAYQGNTMVDLPAAYLGTLSSGTHTLKILFQDDYYATATFTVTGTTTEETETEDTTSNETAAQALTAGTYTVTANLYVPGELNSQLPGVDAYMTNPANPLGVGGVEGIPNTPVSENATLVVTAEGKKILILDVVNPVFTLQAIGSGRNNKVLKTQRDSEVYSDTAGTVSRNGRLTKLWISLEDGSGTYQFANCKEFPTLLGVDWSVDLKLSVDFTGAKRTSDSTDTGLTEAELNGSGISGETSNTGSSTESESETDSSKTTESENTNTQTEGSGTLKAGKYTVAANIWIDKSSSGLPLNPHLTSSAFPPKDPVSRNATLTIDENSNATVVVPIVIQSKVMSIKSISGLNIISSTRSGGYLTSITVDLGKVTNPNAVITKTCTVSLDLGELAQTISGKGQSQVWTATFQVNLSGVPSGSSGGGDVDVSSLIAAATGQTESTTVRISVLPGAESLGLTQMMQETKTTASGETSTQTSGDSQTTSETESAVTWKFTVLETEEAQAADNQAADADGQTADASQAAVGAESAADSMADGAETTAELTADGTQTDSGSAAAEEEQRTELVARLMNSLKNGETDIVLCDVADAAEWAAEANVDGLRIISLTEYSPLQTEETAEEDADAAAESTEDGSAGDNASDGSAADSAADGTADRTSDSAAATSYVAAITTSSFLNKQETAIQKFISEQSESVTYAEEHHTETAAAALALGLYEDAAEAQAALDQTQLTLRTGSEMQPLVDAVLETNAPEEEDYYVPGAQTSETEQTESDEESTDEETAETTAAETDAAGAADESDSGAAGVTEDENSGEDTAGTETGTGEDSVEITDADSLSAAIEEALAKRDEEAGESSVSVSNPSGIDMEAQRAAAAELEPGTYTVSANLYLPGELNTQLTGVTAYMTNPDNPLGVGGHEGIPMTPVSDNATLIVGEDGTKTVIVDVVNPVFTLQGISAPQNSEILAYVRDSERYEGTNGVGVDGRITQLYIQLSDDRGVYPYDDCHEFPTLLETDWYVVLELSVEFTTAQKVSDDTTYTIPEDAVTP